MPVDNWVESLSTVDHHCVYKLCQENYPHNDNDITDKSSEKMRSLALREEAASSWPKYETLLEKVTHNISDHVFGKTIHLRRRYKKLC